MKTIILTLVGLGVIGGIIYYAPTTEFEAIETVIEKEEEVIEVDVIEQARVELERINQELDLKEQELLEQRKAIDAELERVRETRQGF